jgi:hypothetical protein
VRAVVTNGKAGPALHEIQRRIDRQHPNAQENERSDNVVSSIISFHLPPRTKMKTNAKATGVTETEAAI